MKRIATRPLSSSLRGPSGPENVARPSACAVETGSLEPAISWKKTQGASGLSRISTSTKRASYCSDVF